MSAINRAEKAEISRLHVASENRGLVMLKLGHVESVYFMALFWITSAIQVSILTSWLVSVDAERLYTAGKSHCC